MVYRRNRSINDRNFYCTPGETLTILVGGAGTGTSNSGSAGGGGGGSFVMDVATPLIIAGGGGGRRDYGSLGMIANGLGTSATTAQNSADNTGIGEQPETAELQVNLPVRHRRPRWWSEYQWRP